MNFFCHSCILLSRSYNFIKRPPLLQTNWCLELSRLFQPSPIFISVLAHTCDLFNYKLSHNKYWRTRHRFWQILRTKNSQLCQFCEFLLPQLDLTLTFWQFHKVTTVALDKLVFGVVKIFSAQSNILSWCHTCDLLNYYLSQNNCWWTRHWVWQILRAKNSQQCQFCEFLLSQLHLTLTFWQFHKATTVALDKLVFRVVKTFSA